MVIGIDLGTTFSVVAYVNKEGKAEIITNREGDRTTPSVVMFEDGSVVVGEQAKANSVVDPCNVCENVKRQIGRKAYAFETSMNEKYSAEDISAMILKRLKEDAEASRGTAVEGAVITVPAYFPDPLRNATRDAGEIAGLNVMGIINEPTAAAIAYCHGQADNDGNIMVYDLGGGTFDITIMRLSGQLSEVDTLATTGNRFLGGFNFDSVIMDKVIKEFINEYNIDLNDDDMALQDLRIKAESAKKALSSKLKTSISIVSQGHVLKVEITREEFESMIQKYLNSTMVSMDMAMEDAGLQWSDISKILLVGGSTRIPAVQDMIEKHTGIKPSHELNPDEAVALGAAYYADSMYSESTGEAPKADKVIKVTDVNSHSLGIIARDKKTRQNHASFIISRNTPLPAHGESRYTTHYDGQERLRIQVVEGEDSDPDYDTIIGTTVLKLNPRPKDSPISVSIHYDINGIIHVRVRDLVDNTDLGEMHIERKENLTNEDVKKKRIIINGMDIE